MRNRLLVASLLLALTPGVFAQEAITLTTPITRPAINTYTPGSFHIDVLPVPKITVTVVHVASGIREEFSYPCESPCSFTTSAQVQTLITTLNTANLSTRSLWRRIFDRLVLDFPSRFPGGATVQ